MKTIGRKEMNTKYITSPVGRFALTVAFTAALALVVGTVARSAAANGTGVLLLIDRNSITHVLEGSGFTTQDVNDELAAVGMRESLPYFRRNVGSNVTLKTGAGMSPGWFALTGTPTRWASAAGESDGLSNFVLAGAGLGSAEESGERTRLLRDAGLAGMSTANIDALRGRNVCGIVYQGNLTAAASAADLSGKTLGLVAFNIVNVTAVENSLPSVEAKILDIADVCQGDLALPQLSTGQ